MKTENVIVVASSVEHDPQTLASRQRELST